MTTAARASVNLKNAVIETFTVKASSAVTLGMPVTLDSEGVVLDSTAGQNAIGIALQSAVAGALVQVVLANSAAVVKAKVGTAGATAGAYAVVGTTGLTDQTLGGGTTVKYVVGRFLQTGVTGDLIGFMTGCFAGGAT